MGEIGTNMVRYKVMAGKWVSSLRGVENAVILSGVVGYIPLALGQCPPLDRISLICRL